MLFYQNATRRGLSRIEVVVVFLVAVLVIGLALSKTTHVSDLHMNRTQTLNNLKQMVLACIACDNTHRRLPPAFDKFASMNFPAPLHVHLLPYLEQVLIYKSYQPDEQGEAALAMIPPFASPEDRTLTIETPGFQNFAANLRIFSDKGLKTAFDADMWALARIEPGTASIKDSFPMGTSNTVGFATKYAQCGDGGSRYAAAPDSPYAAFFGQNAAETPAHPTLATATFQLNPTKEDCRCRPLMAQSFTAHGISVGLMDGSIRHVSAETSALTWNLALQPNRKMELGEDWFQ